MAHTDRLPHTVTAYDQWEKNDVNHFEVDFIKSIRQSDMRLMGICKTYRIWT